MYKLPTKISTCPNCKFKSTYGDELVLLELYQTKCAKCGHYIYEPHFEKLHNHFVGVTIEYLNQGRNAPEDGRQLVKFLYSQLYSDQTPLDEEMYEDEPLHPESMISQMISATDAMQARMDQRMHDLGAINEDGATSNSLGDYLGILFLILFFGGIVMAVFFWLFELVF